MVRYERHLIRSQLLLNFCISLKNRYLYVPIPKVAHTTVKLALGKLEIRDLPLDASKLNIHMPLCSPFVLPYQLPQGVFEEIIASSDFFKFIFVRNPYTRAVSCYIDKIEREGRDEKKIITDILGRNKSDEVSFTEFLEAVKTQPIPSMNLHWKPQSSICLWDQINYDFVGHLETFETDIATLFERIGQKPEATSSVQHHATHAPDLIGKYVTDQNRKLIEDIYGADFDAFGYRRSPDSPDLAAAAAPARQAKESVEAVRPEREPMEWISAREFALGDTRFLLTAQPADELSLKKHPGMIEEYARLQRSGAEFKRIVEVGSLWGGSAIFLNELFSPEVLLMVDIKDQTRDFFKKYLETERARAFRLHFGMSQDNKPGLRAAVAEAFGTESLDLVIDDASHLYEPTTATFEVLFPRLRAGGIYVIEDWGWAHWPGYWQSEKAPWQQRLALTNLVVELVMICASRREIIRRVQVTHSMVLVERGPAPLTQDFSVRESYYARKREYTPTL